MPKFVHVYTGPNGNSVIEEKEFEMTEFLDTEGATAWPRLSNKPRESPFAWLRPGISWTFTPLLGGSTASR